MENKLEELFNAVKESSEYQEYERIKEILEADTEVITLINDIKTLQKKATKLEYSNNDEYKKIDKTIDLKVKELNNKQVYIEYLNKMEEFNQVLSMSSNIIEKYVNEKIA